MIQHGYNSPSLFARFIIGSTMDPTLLDSIKTHALIAVFSDDVLMEYLVLKGGNAIDIVFQLGHRASLDLDFSISGDFPAATEIRDRLRNSLTKTFEGLGYLIFDINFYEKPEG